METQNRTKNAIDLHREMYAERCRKVKWFRGQSMKQALDRINRVHVPQKQPVATSKTQEDD